MHRIGNAEMEGANPSFGSTFTSRRIDGYLPSYETVVNSTYPSPQLTRIFGREEDQQIRSPVTGEIAGAAPVTTATFKWELIPN